MKFFIKVSPEQGEVLAKCSELSMTLFGESVSCKITGFDGERLYLQPDESYLDLLEEMAETLPKIKPN